MKRVNIDTEFITLGQMLKVSDCISTGGHAKVFLAQEVVHVNGELEHRRGRKLYRGDRIQIQGYGEFTIV
jgi:S4 domain protein YaaA